MKNKILIARLIVAVVLWIIAICLNNYEIASLVLYICSYVIAGYDIVIGALKNIINRSFLDEFFLMSIASIGAFFIGEYLEAAAVMIFFQIGEVFQGIAVEKSRNAIMNTMNLKPTICHLESGEDIDPMDVEIGQIIVVKPGEMVPVDGKALSAGIINTASLTGEALDVDVDVNDAILSGSLNTTTPITIEVVKEYFDSTAAKILDMVENATMKKAKSEKFITKFAKYYTPIVVIMAILLAFIPPLILGFSENYSTWLYRALSFLVVSCPCALVISVPLSYFAGIGAGAKRKIIIKGGSILEDLALCETIILDKTGTLTKAEFEISKIIGNEEEILKIAKGLERMSTHPLAKAINNVKSDSYEFEIEEAPGYGVIGYKDNVRYICGSKKLLAKYNIEVKNDIEFGSILYIAKGDEYLGAIILEDKLKEEAIASIGKLLSLGKRVVVLSGDTNSAVKSACDKLGVKEFYAGLLPSDKVRICEEIINSSKGKVIFVGDGINDAPVLALSDIGVSMGQIGSDAAVEASDIVILNDKLNALPSMLKIAKKTRGIVWQNIIFAIMVKVIVLVLSAVGFLGMEWAIFADVGVCVIAIINAMRALNIKRG